MTKTQRQNSQKTVNHQLKAVNIVLDMVIFL